MCVSGEPLLGDTFRDDKIDVWWCLRDTWRCDAAEAIGIWAVLLFCATIICITVVHSLI